ncbi:MAG: hypothetical protein JSU90_11050 [Nitrospiraceae bacterium]|nr:MAG: hypothetical protein JSU90_11050 [Nitrospiraceae bacterium]
MDIDISINGKSHAIHVENPHRFNVREAMSGILDFGRGNGADLSPCNLDELIPLMVRGVAGCEAGCPSDAMGVARRGFGNFKIEYVEGGILTASQKLDSGAPLEIKIFPDF